MNHDILLGADAQIIPDDGLTVSYPIPIGEAYITSIYVMYASLRQIG